MHTCKDSDQPFQHDDISLTAEKSVKLLGTEINKRMTFTTHVDTLIRKCACQLNALKQKSKMLNKHTKLMIYNAFIEANFSYCPLIWMNRNKIDMKRIQNLQKRALKLVFNEKLPYDQLLEKASDGTNALVTRYVT